MQPTSAVDFLWQSIVAGKQGELIQAQQEYIALLQAELQETVPFAFVNGWRSSRHETGMALRVKIADLSKPESV